MPAPSPSGTGEQAEAAAQWCSSPSAQAWERGSSSMDGFIAEPAAWRGKSATRGWPRTGLSATARKVRGRGSVRRRHLEALPGENGTECQHKADLRRGELGERSRLRGSRNERALPGARYRLAHRYSQSRTDSHRQRIRPQRKALQADDGENRRRRNPGGRSLGLHSPAFRARRVPGRHGCVGGSIGPSASR